ncbi:MAG: response regulator [Caulobacteraceae bacterium]
METPPSPLFDFDALIVKRAAPLLERVLIVDPDAAAARALGELLRLIGPGQIWTAPGPDAAFDLMDRIEPRTVFVEQTAGIEGEAFVRRLRRSAASCRMAVAILLARRPVLSDIIAARDCGAHEVLKKPFTRSELLRRLASAASEPRAWIEVPTYVGPDRRRFNAGDYTGVLRRRTDRPAGAPAANVRSAIDVPHPNLVLGLAAA